MLAQGAARDYEANGQQLASSALQELQNKLTYALKNAHAQAAQMRSIADRLLGPVPEPAVNGLTGGDQKEPPQVRRLEQIADFLVASLDDIGRQVERLSRL